MSRVNISKKAVEGYRKAAETGDAKAQHFLGMMYGDGRGMPQDHAEALKWFRMAAEQGLAEAQVNLGNHLVNERHISMSPEAVKWYRKAAEQGHAEAQVNPGAMHANGEGVAEDDAEAVKWVRKAAEQGDAEAQDRLGNMYANGEDVPEDDVAGYAWFSVAAASGNDGGRENRDDIKRDLTPSQLEKGQAMAREIFERIEKRKAAKKAE